MTDEPTKLTPTGEMEDLDDINSEDDDEWAAAVRAMSADAGAAEGSVSKVAVFRVKQDEPHEHAFEVVWLSEDLEGFRCTKCGFETVEPETEGDNGNAK